MYKLVFIYVSQQLRILDSIKKIDEYLLSFCQRFKNFYGTLSCTINLHLHCHLADCLHDYGPAHGTWCFSFERLNGILGRTPNNKESLKTLITRFIQHIESSRSFPHFTTELENFSSNKVDSINESCTDANIYIKHIELSNTVNLFDLAFDNSLIEPIGYMTLHTLQMEEVTCLRQMYEAMFLNSQSKIVHISSLCYRFSFMSSIFKS